MFLDFARTPKWNCPSPDNNAKPTAPAPTPATTSAPRVPGRQPAMGMPMDTSRSSTGHLNSQSQPSPFSSSGSSLKDAWEIPPIICPADRTFRAQIGPTGGRKGYQAITGRVGWGIAWYINGLLVPELVVQRGKTYTFIVEGGNDPVSSSRRHPLYITDNSEGGYDYRTDEERKQQKIFAGAALRSDGQVVPTAEGRLCEWKIDTR